MCKDKGFSFIGQIFLLILLLHSTMQIKEMNAKISANQRELKCPECGHVFQVSQEAFDSLASQVSKEVVREAVEARERELTQRLKAEELLAEERHRGEMARAAAEQRAAIEARDGEIAVLKARLESAPELTRMEMIKALNERDSLIQNLRKELDTVRLTMEADHRAAMSEARLKAEEASRRKDEEILKLKGEISAERKEGELKIASMQQTHAAELMRKDEMIRYYKDFKTSLSTKMLGESLEQHCMIEFERQRAMGLFQEATFEKDNDASGGSKGDFIFRDYADGEEYVSIMFEMKNEADETATKHRNRDFLDKLHRDRTEKRCEYAVLVSMLERQNELYNGGIVNMSHVYPKMYVVRPQFFMTIITLLSQASRKNLSQLRQLRAELEIARAQSIDVTSFERRRDQFVTSFSKLVDAHADKHQKAVEGIDKVIEQLEKQAESLRKVKALFDTARQKLVKAHETAENDFTIRKLCHGNPTMRKKFDEARKLEENEKNASADEEN